jgi:hypothetical protein
MEKQANRRLVRTGDRAAARFTRMYQGRRPAAQRAVVATTTQPTIWQQFMQRNGLRELANVLAITFAYFITRGIVRGREGDAFANAYTLIEMERSLGIYHERAIQQFALGYGWLIDLVNNYSL